MKFAGLGLFRYDNQDRIVFVNSQVLQIFELQDRFADPDELVGENIGDFVQLIGGACGFRDAVHERGEIHNFECEFQTPAGNRKCVLLDAFPVNDRGQTCAIQVVVRDITGRKAMEDELRESEQCYRRIVETVEEGIWVVDEDNKTVLVNTKTAAMFGCQAQEMIGRSVLAFLDMEHREDCGEVLEKCKKGHRQARDLRFERQDGSALWARVACNPITTMEKSCCGVLLMVTDISERKEYEIELTREKERLAVSLRSIADGVITTDADSHITMMNRVAEELTGWSEQDAIGRPLDEVFKVFEPSTKKHASHIYENVLKDGHCMSPMFKVELLTRDNKRRIVADSTVAIKDDAGDIMGIIIVFRDITQQQRLEMEREKAGRLESLGNLAGGIAHDFNNILTGIAGNISLAQAELAAGSGAADLLKEAERECSRAARLTAQLLTFSRGGAETGAQASIGEAVKQAAEFAARGSNVNVDIKTPPGLWNVCLEAAQVDQIVHNLVRNAVQAMPNGGTVYVNAENVELGGDAVPLGKNPGRYVRLSFQDHGVGIPPDQRDKIIDPYYTTRPDRVGMGLSIVYSILQKNSGWLDIDSAVGKGTRVELYMPAQEQPESTGSKKQDEEEGKGMLQGKKVLVMDDEATLRSLIERVLKKSGFIVDTVSDGAAAIDSLRDARREDTAYDLVILDLTVPGGKGGQEVLSELREVDADVPVIVSSGYANAPAMKSPREFGFDEVLLKPFQVGDLQELVWKTLAAHVSSEDDQC